MDNVKITKEIREGKPDIFIVTVDKGGYFVTQRFKDIKSAYGFVKELEKSDAFYNRKKEGVFSRKHQRIHSLKMISYECIDEEGELASRGMGRTLNLSEGGILLETISLIDTDHTLSISIGIGEKMVDINGKVVFCKKGKQGKFESGIEFMETDEQTSKILRAYIQTIKDQMIPD